jgi:hypothetical protein
MEPRVAIGEFDEGREEFVLYLSSQNPHVQRILLATDDAARARAQDPRGLARRGRRLRLQGDALRRGSDRAVGSRAVWASRSSGRRSAAKRS